jgi:hypothetical protein
MFYPADSEWTEKWIEVLHQAVKKDLISKEELDSCIALQGMSSDLIEKINRRIEAFKTSYFMLTN